MPFIHPGTVISKYNISRLQNLQSSNPYIQKTMKDTIDFASKDLSNPPSAKQEIRVGYNPAPHDIAKMPKQEQEKWIKRKAEEADLIKRGIIAGHEEFTGDSVRCYKHTVAFLITKDERYAKKAIEIMGAWCDKCKKFGIAEENGPLEAGWGLVNFATVAELLKYKSSSWNNNIENKFCMFVDNILYPQFKYHYANPEGILKNWPIWGNWGTTITMARMQYAIFRNNNKEYETNIKNFNMLFDNLFSKEFKDTGKEIETLRDIVHAQFGLAGLTGIAEIMWNQGSDVYSLRNNLLLKSYEYHASILLNKIPADIKGETLNWVKWIPANWEIAYNHYCNRRQLDMPLSKQILDNNRPEFFEMHWGLGTLTHYYDIKEWKNNKDLSQHDTIYTTIKFV
jgi:hypothetical protein